MLRVTSLSSFAGAAPTLMFKLIFAVYATSKVFLRPWSKALVAELGPKGVLVEA
jgi:short-subunit dehydrogenase